MNPKPITKTWVDSYSSPFSYSKNEDEITNTDDGIYPKPFVFPKNLAKLNDMERQQLFTQYQEHVQTSDGSFQESKVITAEEAFKLKEQKMLQKLMEESTNEQDENVAINSQITFDPEKGYIVPADEDPNVLFKFDIPEEQKQKLLKPHPKQVTEQQAENVRINNLPLMEREIEQRFKDIII